MPILICERSLEMTFWTLLVIRWHPLEGAVIDNSCWNHFMVICSCCEDWQTEVGVEEAGVGAPEIGGTTKQVTTETDGRRKNPRVQIEERRLRQDFMASRSGTTEQ